MILTNEEKVTRLLSQKEIIQHKNIEIYKTNPNYNLGNFLMQEKNAISKWGSKYIFIK